MKKIYTYIGKPMSKKEIRDLQKNLMVQMFNPYTLSGFILLASLSLPITKGKLGFDLLTADGDFVRKAKAVHAALLADAGGYYTVPFANLAALLTAIDDFETEMANMDAGVLGTPGAKNVAKRKVMKYLKKALNYINDLAFDQQLNAVEIITGSTMLVNMPITQDKQDLKANVGPGVGVVMLYAKAVKWFGKYQKATYEWQFTIDRGTTWEDLPYTNKAKTRVTGMLTGIETSFRKRSFSEKTGLSPWSEWVSVYPI